MISKKKLKPDQALNLTTSLQKVQAKGKPANKYVDEVGKIQTVRSTTKIISSINILKGEK